MENFDIRQINNNYAPGIATYGIDGGAGLRGESGTSVYFTSYNLEYSSSNENEQNEVLVKINQNKILSKYVDEDNIREYNIGDIIIDSAGYVYSIYDNNGSKYLRYISRLKTEDSSNYFSKVNERVMLNYDGLDIVSGGFNSNLEESDFPLRIVSVDKNSVNGDYNLIQLIAYSYLDDEKKYLNIFYNNNDDSFHFETESNIVFDTSSLMVKGTDTKENFSDYYKVEPYNDPIGLLHRVYSDASYGYDSESGILTIGDFHNNFPNIEIIPDFVKIKVLNNDYSIKIEKIFTIDKTKSRNIDDWFEVEIGNVFKNIDKDKRCVSLIKGVEIFIKSN